LGALDRLGVSLSLRRVGQFPPYVYDPDRSKTTPDDSFGPTEYKDITGLAVEDADVRNLVDGIYFDANGNKHTRTAQNAASQAKYGVKFMEIQLAAGDQIDSDDEMDRLLAAAVADLGAPFATHEMETLYYWPVQLGDLHQYNPNLDHYDSAQFLAVVGYTHKYAAGECWSTIQCRGNVIGAFHAWLRRSAPGGTTPDELTIKRITWAESADEKSRAATVTCGDAVDTLHVHHRLWPDAATTGDPFDFSQSQDESGAEDLEIVRPSVSDGLFRFSIPHPPRGYTITGRMVPRSAPPTIAAGESMPFQVLPAPPSINVGIHPTRTGDTGALSITVAFGVSDGPVHVDVIQDTLAGSSTILGVDLAGGVETLSPAGYPVLGGIALPAGKDYLTFRVVVTDINGIAWVFGPAHLGRDPLADATVTLQNYRASPIAVIAFGPDTDAIRVTSHDGITTTWNAAALATIGSPVLYTLGSTLRDNVSTETVLVVDETRSGFKVEAQGGGTWTTIFGPADLHGVPSNPPTAKITTVKAADGSSEDIHVVADSPVGEKLRVHFRDGSITTSPIFGLCNGAADSTPLFVTPGTDVGPANFFQDESGAGSPAAKFSAIALTRDQIRHVAVQVEGKDSGVRSPWLPLDLSLLEQPWLESVALEYNAASGNLELIIKGGAHCASAFYEIADNSSYTSPTTGTLTLADGGRAAATRAMSSSDVGKTWYVRVTPYSGMGLTGLFGVAQEASATSLSCQPSVCNCSRTRPTRAHDRIVWSCAQGTALVSIDGGRGARHRFAVRRRQARDRPPHLRVPVHERRRDGDRRGRRAPGVGGHDHAELGRRAGNTRRRRTMPYTATAANPVTAGAAPTITVKCVGCSMTIAGTTYPDGTTQTIASATVVTGNKGASSSTTNGNLEFVATLGNATERIVVPVPPQSPIGGVGSVQVSRNTPDSLARSLHLERDARNDDRLGRRRQLHDTIREPVGRLEHEPAHLRLAAHGGRRLNDALALRRRVAGERASAARHELPRHRAEHDRRHDHRAMGHGERAERGDLQPALEYRQPPDHHDHRRRVDAVHPQ
jgi:hypothetical protein